MQPSTIDSIPSEVLPLMFDNLSSSEKARSLSICKRWLEVLNEYQFLWRRVDLAERNGGWPSSVLDMFDRKSASTLREIKMDISWESKAVEHFLETIGKQKDTLRVLHLRADWFANETISKTVSSCSSLLDCRFTTTRADDDPRKVRLLTDGIHRKEASNHHKTGFKLKILWNPMFRAPMSNFHLLCNLVSFHTSYHLKMDILWSLLKECSQTLKHLSASFTEEPERSFQGLEFPQLQVFEFHCSLGRLPTWMKIPFSVTLVCLYQLPSLPSVSKIWLHHLIAVHSVQRKVDELAFRCPEVAEILVENSPHQGKNNDLTSKDCQLYVAMLRQRRQNVAAGMTVDGVRMLNLKRLVVPFTNLTDEDLFDLRELAEEVVDLNTQQRFIEVEV